MSPVRCLSFHAAYRCLDSGVCCTSGWPIPVENDRLDVLSRAIAGRRLVPLAEDSRWVTTDSDGAAVLTVQKTGCVFFDGRPTRHCRVQHALGHDALPVACRQFPRISLVDPRGVSVTLSHYCPTAASFLAGDDNFVIVDSPAGFPADGEYVGLDLREALPPLLRPDMAMDWESWWRWEARAIALLAEVPSADEGLARLAMAVEAVRRWSPADGPLPTAVDAAFQTAQPGTRRAFSSGSTRTPGVFLAEVMSAIPAGFRPPSLARGQPPTGAVLRRLVAAHAFANWTAHLGEGLRTWLCSLEAVVALAHSGFSISTIDLLLRHLSDPRELSRTWGAAERR